MLGLISKMTELPVENGLIRVKIFGWPHLGLVGKFPSGEAKSQVRRQTNG